MHALWLSLLLPTMIGLVWIWPQLRFKKLWWAFCGLAVLGTMIWVANDLYAFVNARGSYTDSFRRILYLFVSSTSVPALEITLSLLAAAIFSKRFSKKPLLATDDRKDGSLES